MLSLANPQKYYQLFLAQGVGMGLGSGLLLVPAMSVQSHHWRKRRSLAMGFVMTGERLIRLIPIMLNQLIHGRTGFAWGVRATAFLTLGLLVIANCIMTTRLPSAKQRPNDKPASLGAVVTDIPYMIALTGMFLVLWGLFFPYFYLQLWVSRHGLSNTLAFYTIAILNAGSILGRTLPNMIADQYGQVNVFVPVAFITGILVLAMFGVTSTGAVIVFSILYGFFSGGSLSLMPPGAASMSKSVNEIGLRIGFLCFFTSFALLTGTPIVGALYDVDYHWFRPIIFSGVVIIAGSLVTAVSRQLLVRRKGSPIV